MTQWRPRTGLTMTQFKFKRDLIRLLAAFGLPPDALYESQPHIQVASAQNAHPKTRLKTERDDADDQALAEQTERLALWQRVNTAVYWHLVPAIVIDGPHFLEDSAVLDSYTSGQLANGRGLALWALAFADVSEFSAQLLIANELAGVKVKPDATLAQLAVHLQKMNRSAQNGC